MFLNNFVTILSISFNVVSVRAIARAYFEEEVFQFQLPNEIFKKCLKY